MCLRLSLHHDTLHTGISDAADPFRSLTLTQTDAHTLPRTPLMMCFYMRWELNLHFTPCLFLEFLTVSLDLSSGDLRDPVLGWRGMTARLLISNCVCLCECVCVRVLTGWKNRGSLSSPWVDRRVHGGAVVDREQTQSVSTHWAEAHQPNACAASFSLLLWIFVDSLGRLQNIIRDLVPQG